MEIFDRLSQHHGTAVQRIVGAGAVEAPDIETFSGPPRDEIGRWRGAVFLASIGAVDPDQREFRGIRSGEGEVRLTNEFRRGGGVERQQQA